MRILTISGIILISGLAVLTVYLKIDEKRFEESLSKPTTTGSEPVKKGKKNGLSKTGVDDLKLAPIKQTEQGLSQSATDTQSETVEQSIEDLIDEVEFDIDHGNTEQDIDSIDEQVDAEENDSPVKNRDPNEYLYHTPSGRPDPIYAMSPSEQEIELQRRRQKLIEDYGDTPEVRILIKHFHSRVMPRGTRLNFKGKEGLEVLRAMSVVWPTDSNVNTYNSLKAMQENGWHAQ